ncbi:MAG: DUF4405 domain-containing protein [Deltaproteobacteria bacterium]|nr:DUF4405 domain-containing protein [Deltaproteobacteria bacterium]
MKKNTINFWIDFILLIEFMLVVLTGVVLREFPGDLSGYTVLGLPRKDFADLHWMLSLLMILFLFTHMVLHWSWAKAASLKMLRISPKVLAVSAIVLVVLSMVLAPVYLTKDLPDQRKSQNDLFKPELSVESVVSFNKVDSENTYTGSMDN